MTESPRSRRDGERPHRAAPHPDIVALIDAAGGVELASPSELAAATAAVVVSEGRGCGGDERFVRLADRVGLDTLAELWRDAEPVSLPGALWALYLLRQWCHSAEDEVVRLWRAGQGIADVEAAVAGVDELADVGSVRRVADAVLTGVYGGDLAVALERAAALFRVIAAGRRELAGGGPRHADEYARAARNEKAAADLASAARRWREGTLR